MNPKPAPDAIVEVSRFDDERVLLTIKAGPPGGSRVQISALLTDDVAKAVAEALNTAVGRVAGKGEKP